MKYIKASDLELKEKVVSIQRVAKVVKGGRQFSFSAITVVGNGNGKIGMGYGKAKEVPLAIQKSMQSARKNLHSVTLKKETIYYETTGRYGASKVFMRPAADGTGIIAGGAMRAVMESAGIKDVLAKSKGSSNPHNVVKATFNGLMKLRDPLTVAKQRGKNINQIFNG